jgi:hypothetical protein
LAFDRFELGDPEVAARFLCGLHGVASIMTVLVDSYFGCVLSSPANCRLRKQAENMLTMRMHRPWQTFRQSAYLAG